MIHYIVTHHHNEGITTHKFRSVVDIFEKWNSSIEQQERLSEYLGINFEAHKDETLSIVEDTLDPPYIDAFDMEKILNGDKP